MRRLYPKFVNQSRNLCKVLLWDGSGQCIFQKRLEQGTFAKLWRDDGQVVRLTASELALYIEGCTLVGKHALSRSRSSDNILFRIARCDQRRSVAISEADIEREHDVEELRRIALAHHAQIRQLIEELRRKCDTLSFYTGNKDELQETLALIEGLTQQAKQLESKAKKVGGAKPPKKPRSARGRRRSHGCRTCPSASSSTRRIAFVRAAAAVCSR